MKKVVLSILLLLISIGSVFSQFDVQLSQYMFHISSFNPAAVGEGDMIHIVGQDRMQWLGIPNAGQTLLVSINSPLKIGNSNNGIGLTFMKDQVGQFIDESAHLQYAYKRKVGVGVLSLGVDLGFVSIGFNNGDSIQSPSHAIPIGDYHDITDDPEIPKTAVVGMSFDMNVGVFYSTPAYYGGLSYMHLNNPTVTWGDKSEFKQYGSLFITGGYNLVMANPKYVFKPSTLFKTDFSSWQFDLTSRMEYDNKYWGGISYRFQDAVVILAGIEISSGLSIGCSYDVPTSQIITVSPGSLEFLVMYDLQYILGKRNSKYKSIRIL
jgi:type IX secretion system PorP/SprF family membrane protein